MTIDSTPDSAQSIAPRRLGRSGLTSSALGIGTWALGGPMVKDGVDLGWGAVDDAESIRALHAALDLGVTLIDTSDAYGTGHAERVIARALSGRRDEVLIATKWGNTIDEATHRLTGEDASTEYARGALTASLERLGTDHVDLWQLHLGGLEIAAAEDLFALAESLIDEGLIRAYGWSTDDPARAAALGRTARGSGVQAGFNVLSDAPELVAAAEAADLALLVRSPLAMGLLSDKVTADTLIAEGDVRRSQPEWLQWFTAGRPTPEFLHRREAVREVLRSQGRTLAQGALAWLWARSARAVPIPGVRTLAQARENAGALSFGPLTPDQFAEVEVLLGRGSAPESIES